MKSTLLTIKKTESTVETYLQDKNQLKIIYLLKCLKIFYKKLNEKSSVSKTKKIDFLNEQTKTKPQKTLEPKLKERKETLSFHFASKLEARSWNIALTGLGLHN